MKRPLFGQVLFIPLLCLAFAPALAQQGDEPEYQPPSRGAPSGRIGGGTRAPQRIPPVIAVSPDHTGQTINAQPVLYYFMSTPAVVRLAVRPANEPGAPALVDRILAPPAAPGIHRVELKTLGVSLTPGVEYRWTMSVPGEAREASATIVRVEPAAGLAQKLSATSGAKRYGLLAREGLWYDALDEVSRAIDAAPKNAVPARHRAALLEQVGLIGVARFERQRYE